MSANFKRKLYIGLAVFLLIFGVLFGYVYKWLDGMNHRIVDGAFEQYKEFEGVLAEQRSFEAGQKDLETLAEKPYQPENLFSQDVKLVKEIRELEALAAEEGLSIELQVSGSAKEALKVQGTKGELFSIPYVIAVDGPFGSVVRFLEAIEHSGFVTHVHNVSINNAESGKVNAAISGKFFIRK